LKQYIKYNWPSILWAAFILVICMMPHKHVPRVTIPQFDKLVHAVIYAILAILLYFGWERQIKFVFLQENMVIKIFVLCALYGFVIEILQGLFTVDRSFELLDELADVIGASLGLYFVIRFYEKPKES